MSADRYADSKRAGERVEHSVIDSVDEIEPVADVDAPIDARAKTAIVPSDELPFASICIVESGTPVEIKSAMVVIKRSNGGQQQRGRFYLRRQQHEHLLDVRGIYLFVVTAPQPQRPLLAKKVVPAAVVEDLRNDWKTSENRQAYDQLSWSRLFDVHEVEGGDQL